MQAFSLKLIQYHKKSKYKKQHCRIMAGKHICLGKCRICYTVLSTCTFKSIADFSNGSIHDIRKI